MTTDDTPPELALPAPDLVARLQAELPALRAYPATDRFVGAIGGDDVLAALRRQRPGIAWGLRIDVTRRDRRTLQALRDEAIAALCALGHVPVVSRVHVDGGLPEDELAALLAFLRASFALPADAEVGLRIAASACTLGRVARLREAGVQRLALVAEGERVPRLAALVAAARAARFAGVTLEVGDGALAAMLRPDRIRLARPACQGDAIERLAAAGYRHVALGEFALARDPLAVAARQGRLHLGAGGLAARPQAAILALGPGAEGRIGNIAYRNVDAVSGYCAALAAGRLPVGSGLALCRDELARQGVISALLCQGRVDFEAIDVAHLIDMRRHFAREFALLQPLARAGLVEIDDEAVALTATGRWLAPVVAAVFDRELQRDAQRRRACVPD